MTAPMRQAGCRENATYLGPYLDGELDTATQLQLEEHVSQCDTCSERIELLRSSRETLKRTVKTAAPAGLRSRITTAMLAEQARADARAAAPAKAESRVFTARVLVPIAAAAVLALVWGATQRNASSRTPVQDDLLADLVAEHSQPLPPEHTDPKDVRGLEKYVGVPVHPARFERGGVNFVGARVLPVHQQRAAMLQYVVGTGSEARRVSVLVYDPQKIQVHNDTLAPRSVGTAQLQVGRAKGYSVAVMERGGVGYAVATDLDSDRSAQFAAAGYEE